MIVFLQLTTAGSDSGPFNLYSDTNGYAEPPFETDVFKSSLEAGYTTDAPDGTQTVKVVSTGACINSTYITLAIPDCDLAGYVEEITTTTTTTTLPIVPCGGVSDSGGLELLDRNVSLDPAGGVIVFLFDPVGQVDKLEIYHGLPQNAGVNKKATTSQSAPGEFGGNYGPFDNVWGTPSDNSLPDDPSLPVDQFIGTNKGIVPTRQTQFTADTGYDIPNMTIGGISYDQIVWWKYTSADYLINPIATIRATGGSTNTVWYSLRACPTTTTTTTTSAPTSTTTTTTTYVCPNCIPGADVLIGTQLWTICNLDVDTYRDLTPIPQATSDADWANKGASGIGAWRYYADNTANGPRYGKLYNWFAVNNTVNGGLAPLGYHVPSDTEWTQLTDYLDAQLPTGNVGGKMKATGTIEGNDGCWLSPNTAATNSNGFKAQPGGLCDQNGTFDALGYNGLWWSSTEYNANTTNAWNRSLYYLDGNAARNINFKTFGFSVRLIKD
jgi:uncharacterized protein (TIGR02145 family)